MFSKGTAVLKSLEKLLQIIICCDFRGSRSLRNVCACTAA